MEWNIDDPTELFAEIWRKLGRATADRREGWRNATVATVSEWGPEARTVVLRRADRDERALCFHTDARSPKLDQLALRPELSWLFWDPKAQVQLRVKSTVELHRGDATARWYWERESDAARALFEKIGRPGAPIADRTAPDDAFEAFVWVVTTALELDWLWLARPEHRRQRFDLEAGTSERVVP